MLILLPPSEGKARPETGPHLDLSKLSHHELTPAREQVLAALVQTSARSDADKLLKVSQGLLDEVLANRLLLSAPTAPAIEVYTGVLYQALSASSWSADIRARATGQLVIFSALFGVLSPDDQIPAYRLSGGVKLPGIGSLSTFWHSQLTPVMEEHDLIVDARSNSYAPMWRPSGATPIRVFTERDGVRKTVSHLAKHIRGLVAGALLSTPEPRSRGEAVELLNDWFTTYRENNQIPERIWAEDSNSSINVISASS